jgi:hypothetical protein
LFQKGKRDGKIETLVETQPGENEPQLATNPSTERDEEGNVVNSESSVRDLAPQGLVPSDVINNRLKVNDQDEQQQQQPPKVQFTPTNNYFKNVAENKDLAKLVSQLATCINATKKV